MRTTVSPRHWSFSIPFVLAFFQETVREKNMATCDTAES
jgi:hypothetical protein